MRLLPKDGAVAYQWELDPEDLFVERRQQMTRLGLPESDVDAVRAAITDMWPDQPGGWVFEWSRLAGRYVSAGRHDLAMLAYGWAKFPTLADDAKRAALAKQVEQYQLAAATFPVRFSRQMINGVPVHVLAAPDLPADAPVLIASGGVDSWKMDLHPTFVAFALHARVRVLAFDLPGTGEAPGPMTPDGVSPIVTAARALGNGTVAHLGISMGGYYSARNGLAGEVDAAIVLGGPVEHAFAPGREARFGMAGIVGNALGFDHPPTPAERDAAWAGFSLRPLLDQDRHSPMLIMNGADDVHVPPHDTLVFTGRRDTEVELVPDSGHCAVAKFGDVLPTAIRWLVARISR